MPFYPGPGLGGHCTAIDPLYLEWKSKMDGFDSRFVGLADSINTSMPRYVVDRAIQLLNARGQAVSGSRVYVLGVTYKKDVCDTRESPALEVIKLLMKFGARVTFSDPFVASLNIEGEVMESIALSTETLRSCELVVITADHSAFDYVQVVRHAPLVFDTRNATDGLRAKNLVRL
jgi:UDP-N-acetyl-D-glucosamine dehydrogenase